MIKALTICCDIDGVLADCREYVGQYLPQDWDAYFSHTSRFPAIDPMCSVIRQVMYLSGRIHFVTGRPESNRRDTMAWLFANKLISERSHDRLVFLHMRLNGDYRSGCEIKMEWFRRIHPDLVVDDDPSVIRAAVEAGYIALQVCGYRHPRDEIDRIPYRS